MGDPPARSGALRVLFCNWRDLGNPEGGGSEVYVESVARALSTAGHQVTIACAAYPGAPADEVAGGVRYVRRGSKLGVYPSVFLRLLTGRLGRFDAVVDVQNGVPFASTLATRTPVVVLVHHVHREQWPVVYGPVRSRIGWLLESRVGPCVYRHARYVAVSAATRRELTALGVPESAITVVHNGVDPAVTAPAPADQPTILVLGRLVPHKRVEHVLTAAAVLRSRLPGLRVRVVGDGWWAPQLAARAQELGLSDVVDFLGFVDEASKHRELAAAWVLALPSLKEGWGLVVMEAACYGVPTVAYRTAGGVAESVRDAETGLLVDDQDAFTAALGRLLCDSVTRARLGSGAAAYASTFGWQATATAFAAVLTDAAERTVRPGQVKEAAHVQHRSATTVRPLP